MISALLPFFRNDDCRSDPPLSMKKSISSMDNLHRQHLSCADPDTGRKRDSGDEYRYRSHKNRISEAYEPVVTSYTWKWENVWGHFVDTESPVSCEWEIKLKKKHPHNKYLVLLRERDVHSLSPNVRTGGTWMESLQEYDEHNILDEYESTMYMGFQPTSSCSLVGLVVKWWMGLHASCSLRMRMVGVICGVGVMSILSVLKAVALMKVKGC